MTDSYSHINLLQGTHSVSEYSTGNTLPLVARPWGMHHWSLQTNDRPWFFHRESRKLWGIRLTHQPSPWMHEYGSLMLQPFHGDYNPDPDAQASGYRPEDTVLQPAYMQVTQLRYGITIELSPSERGALFRFTRSGQQALRIRLDFPEAHGLTVEPGKPLMHGWTADAHEGGDMVDFSMKFVGEFSVSPERFERTETGGYLVFPADCGVLDLRFAASFISDGIAEVSLRRELPEGISPREFARQGEAQWNALLDRVSIRETWEGQAELFYSCLYRCLLFPRFLDERDGEGAIVHYSPYDGQVHPGRLCADTGFWDTYRTLQPLLTWIYPDVMEQMMEGWLNVCRESGWTPKWPSPGARNCMIGTHFNVTAADLVVKGLTNWNVEEIYEYLRKDAFVPSEDGRFGRQGLEDYMQLGFVAHDRTPYALSSTLDYAYDDFCILQIARYLGRESDVAVLEKRAQNYQNVFDTATGFMRPKNHQGHWVEPFDEFEWGGAYIEGGPWQHTFNVPHDVQGMARLWGGPKPFCEKLDGMLSAPPRFEAGHYGREIHEMTEMALASFGQYAHSNQPVHNYLFLFAQCGQPEKTDMWVGRILKELYSIDHFPGDEDNGEMSAWYIWASLGLYPVCPGKPEYLKIQPRVRNAEIRIPGSDGPIELDECLSGVQSGEFVSHHALTQSAAS